MKPYPLTEKFTEALQLAAQWHAGQFRKGTDVPYVSHLLGVASVALEFGATETEAVAALLHDALEDGPEFTGRDAAALRAEIQARFGAQAARLVDGATDATPAPGEQKAPWADRKLAYLARVRGKDAAVLLVTAADKLHNARSILSDVRDAQERGGEVGAAAVFTRFKAGREGTLQYYRLLVDAYRAAPAVTGRARLSALIAELDWTVGALEAACGVDPAQVRAFAPLHAGVTP